jgi:hypothetical protein
MCNRWLAQFNQAIEPQCSAENGGTFTFQYAADDTTERCPSGFQTDIRFVCGLGQVNPMTVIESTECLLILEEVTSLACLDVDCGAAEICYWPDLLDIRPLQDLAIPIECPFDRFFMLYQPCMNSVQCLIGSYMSVLMDVNTKFCIFDLASFDADLAPFDTSTADVEQYTFHYVNGAQSGACSSPRELFITFICDYNEEHALPYDAETLECGEYTECIYYLNIHTYYACSGTAPPNAPTITSTTPAPVPMGLCQWPNLDIRALTQLDTPIQCVFDYGYSSYLLQYSPCSDSLSCMLDGPFMVIQSNGNTNICIVNLASYDENVSPVDTSAGGVEQYALHYKNGKVSGSCFSPREIVITFICDESAIPYDTQTIECGETAQCVYYMDIPTTYACS